MRARGREGGGRRAKEKEEGKGTIVDACSYSMTHVMAQI
jgi:hypothetical protein